MKKLSLVLGILFGAGPLFAQPPVAKLDRVPQHTKVAVVNVRKVFAEYDRAKAFNAHLGNMLLAYQLKAKKLTDEIEAWSAELRSPGIFNSIPSLHFENAIIKNQRALQEMEREIKDRLSKKQEDNLVILWQDINANIKAHAEAYGFHIVLGYGEPERMMFSSRSTNPKMQAMDQGGLTPLYIHGSVDMTDSVISSLNSRRPHLPPQKD